MTDPRPGMTLGDALAALEAEGYTGQMAARPGGRIVCFTCHKESPAVDVDMREVSRVEGVSDPDDMLAVAALVCPQCGTRGTGVFGYGPEATPEDSEVLALLHSRR